MDASTIGSNTYGDTNGGAIDLALTRGISLSNASAVGTTASADFGLGLGRGGDIQVAAPQMNIDASFVVSQTLGEGAAGGVSVQAGTVGITGGGSIGSLTQG